MDLKFKPSEKRQILRALGLFTNIGLTLVVCVLGCLLFGKWLDSVFGTSPLFLLIFIVLGIASGAFNLYKLVMHSLKD